MSDYVANTNAELFDLWIVNKDINISSSNIS